MIFVAAGLAAVLTYWLIAGLLPWLRSCALAHPNHRSSHATPTPQGAGLAVISVTMAACLALLFAGRLRFGSEPLVAASVLAGTVGLCAIGLLDDVHGLGIGARFAGQAVAVAGLIAALPHDVRVFPADYVPIVVERGFLALSGVWFVNLFNFMDGIDWIAAVETTSISGGFAALWLGGLLAGPVGPTALVLLGATWGFATWNRPRARVFLGDAGSLPIGFVLFWMMVEAAARGAWAAVILVSLYYWADATITLIRRIVRGERFWNSHREHFYQQATRPGRLGVPRTLAWIGGLDLLLLALGLAAEALGGLPAKLSAIAVGSLSVVVLLHHFADRRQPAALSSQLQASS